MSTHDRYEELCALAALGELPAEDLEDFRLHVAECPICAEALDQFSEIVQAGLTIESKTRSLHAIAGEHVQQFLNRAHCEGVTFSAEAISDLKQTGLRWYRPTMVAAAVLLMGVLVTWIWLLRAHEAPAIAKQETEHLISELSQEIQQLQAKLNEYSAPGDGTRSKQVAQQTTPPEGIDGAALARQEELLQQLERSQQENRAFQSALERGHASNEELAKRVSENAAMLADAKSEIDALRVKLSQQEAETISDRLQAADLQRKLKDTENLLEQHRSLLAAGKDIRDLMGARSLHIVDVYDLDTKGKARKSFGRIFYTEARSLIFYAYDLDKSASRKNVSFQAWGKRESQTASPISLGLFYVDDQAQKRWIFKVEDPEVLKRIDSVFVTVEPQGGREHPSGQKLLYAYLGHHPNHP